MKNINSDHVVTPIILKQDHTDLLDSKMFTASLCLIPKAVSSSNKAWVKDVSKTFPDRI